MYRMSGLSRVSGTPAGACNGCRRTLLFYHQRIFRLGSVVKSVVDVELRVRYVQQRETTGIFGNVTAVLPLSGQMGDHKGVFSVPGGLSSDRAPSTTTSKWQDRRIISGQKSFLG